MGTIEQGYLGGFSGKLGTAVGSRWKGLSVVRARPPRKRRGQPSDAQSEAQARFGLMTSFLRPLTDLLNETYKQSAGSDMSGFNKAFSENSDAITGIFPAITVDYGKLLLSKGRLPNAAVPSAASTAAGKLAFNWTDNSGISKALATDQAFVAAYNEELDHWVFFQNAAPRNAGTYTLDVAAFSGKPAHGWIGFMSADRKKVATSMYTGVVNIL